MRLIVTAAVTSLAVATVRIEQADVAGPFGAAFRPGNTVGANDAVNDNPAVAAKP